MQKDQNKKEGSDNFDLKKGDQIEKIERLLKENLEMNNEIKSMVKHINTYVAWQKIFAWLKLLLIVVPIILGVIYLPPLFQNLYQQMISIISGGACQ